MRLWTGLALTSGAVSVLTLGTAVVLGLGLMVANTHPTAMGVYLAAALGGNVVLVALVNRAVVRKFYPHTGAGLGSAVMAAGLMTLALALVPLVILGIVILMGHLGRAR